MRLPPELLNSLKDVKGFDEKAFIDVHQNTERITSIRLNSFKTAQLDFSLGKQVTWCKNGFYLEERPSFTFDPLFHAGCYYVQEAGSMFIDYVLKNSVDLTSDLTVLDLCGAPGGKSTLLNNAITSNSTLISNEVIRARADLLAYNLSKWGTHNCAVTNNDPEVFSKMGETFDVIVADVPCSGSGLFRKQNDAIGEWSVNNVQLCCNRQKRIVADVLPALKNGGVLIYSTCSYSKEENEDVVSWLCSEFGLTQIALQVPEEWNIIDTGFGYRFFPYLVKSEGFFCAVLQKPGHAPDKSKRSRKQKNDKPSQHETTQIAPFVNTPTNSELIKFKDDHKLVSDRLNEFRNDEGQNLYYKKFGTTLGQLKHNDFIPDHELALSIYLSEKVNRIELTREQAIVFLQKENLSLSEEKGLALMCYKNHGLGWAKILDKRINNYLPKDFRILTKET